MNERSSREVGYFSQRLDALDGCLNNGSTLQLQLKVQFGHSIIALNG